MRLQTLDAAARPAAWPDAVAFREAIQNPAAALTDPELADAEVVCDRAGLPVAYSGRFAVVFRLRTRTGGDWAVRCFTHAAGRGERQAHYDALAARLPALGARVVPFRYVERGIRVGADWYPVVAMRWAEGESLERFVEENRRDPESLSLLAETLTELLGALERAGVAHGDWQHDNLLVKGGGASVTLVDYDGVFVPELAGLGVAPRENGHPNYQHPGRAPGQGGVGVDRFAHRVMTTALLALACDPSLWGRFNDGESLLFTRRDFLNPSASPVFAAVREVAANDPELSASLDTLEAACVAPPERVEASANVPWWLAPEATTVVRSVASSAVAATPPAAESREFLDLLEEAIACGDEELAVSGVRVTGGGLVLLAVLLTVGGGFAPVALVLFLLSVCILLDGYLSWPARRIGATLSAELLDANLRERRVHSELWLRRDGLQGVDAELTTSDCDEFVERALSRLPVGLVLTQLNVSPRTIVRLLAIGIRTAADLHGAPGELDLLPEDKGTLLRWHEGVEAAARTRFHSLRQRRQMLQKEIARLQEERSLHQTGRERLLREQERLPDASFGAYVRRLLGKTP